MDISTFSRSHVASIIAERPFIHFEFLFFKQISQLANVY